MKVISQYIVNELNAGPKAKVDVEKILQDKFSAKIYNYRIKNDLSKKINLYLFRMKKLLFQIFHYWMDDIVVYQLPLNKNQKTGIKSKKSVGLIHDVEGLRQEDKELLKKEINLYNKMDILISHNKSMTKFLVKNGVTKPIIELMLFDYLIEDKKSNNKSKKSNAKEIVFVGNFSKAPFLSELSEKKMNFQFNLYGVGNYDKNNKKIKYFGSFLPDELPNEIAGDLGLVWDGSLTDENNLLLSYTRYNNPHKLSCYIAAGLPVIVWDKSAVAEFVIENNIGYTISNIYDINKIDFSDYKEKKKNVLKQRKKIINGEYTKAAIDKCLKVIDKEN